VRPGGLGVHWSWGRSVAFGAALSLGWALPLTAGIRTEDVLYELPLTAALFAVGLRLTFRSPLLQSGLVCALLAALARATWSTGVEGVFFQGSAPPMALCLAGGALVGGGLALGVRARWRGAAWGGWGLALYALLMTQLPHTSALALLWFAGVAIVGSPRPRFGAWLPVLLLLGGRGQAPSVPPADERPDVMVVVVDTLRADLGEEMDFGTQLSADHPVVYAPAVASGGWTLPSVASLVTGTPFSTHGVGRPAQGPIPQLPSHLPTLAERFREAGYATAAVVAPNGFLPPGSGLERGFATYDYGGLGAAKGPLEGADGVVELPFSSRLRRPRAAGGLRGAWLHMLGAPERTSAAALAQRAAQVVAQAGTDPAFTWVHLLDPHLPYTHATRDLGWGATLRAPTLRRLPVPAANDPYRRALVSAYRREIREVDEALSALWEATDRGRPRRWVVVSDHGEAFWEHETVEHGDALWEELARVPLWWIGFPEVEPPAEHAPWSHLDVAATLGTLVGEPLGEGHNLRSGPVPPRTVKVENLLYGSEDDPYGPSVAHCLYEAGEKRCAVGPDAWRVGLEDDPQERRLLPWAPDDPTSPPSTDPAPSPLHQRALEQLGYVE